MESEAITRRESLENLFDGVEDPQVGASELVVIGDTIRFRHEVLETLLLSAPQGDQRRPSRPPLRVRPPPAGRNRKPTLQGMPVFDEIPRTE